MHDHENETDAYLSDDPWTMLFASLSVLGLIIGVIALFDWLGGWLGG